jgi:hypothetical protein
MNQKQNTDEMLAILDSQSRKARIISLVITACTLALGLALLIGLFYSANSLVEKRAELSQANAELSLANADLFNKKAAANEATIEAAQARAQYEWIENKAAKIKEFLDEACKKQNCNTSPDAEIREAREVLGASTKGSNSKKTVYVQIVDCEQRERVKGIIKNLNGEFYFHGIQCLENLKGKILETQVKYFNENDLLFARDLVTKLGNQNINANLVLAKGSDNSPLEIWFSGNLP